MRQMGTQPLAAAAIDRSSQSLRRQTRKIAILFVVPQLCDRIPVCLYTFSRVSGSTFSLAEHTSVNSFGNLTTY